MLYPVFYLFIKWDLCILRFDFIVIYDAENNNEEKNKGVLITRVLPNLEAKNFKNLEKKN